MRAFFVLLLSAVACLGQGFGFTDVAFMAQHATVAAGGGAYTANATTFATSQYQTNNGLTGVANSKIFTASMWIKVGTDSTRTLIAEAGPFFIINRNFGGALHITAENAATTTILDATTGPNAAVAGGGWNHILISIDLSSTLNRHIYTNDVEDTSVTWTTYSNDTIQYSRSDTPSWGVGADQSGGSKFDGCLSELYFNFATYIDFSNATNRRKFDDGGSPLKPVDLGTDGSTPTGTAPIMYFKDPYTSFGNNSGTGGNFGVENGPYTSCVAP